MRAKAETAAIKQVKKEERNKITKNCYFTFFFIEESLM